MPDPQQSDLEERLRQLAKKAISSTATSAAELKGFFRAGADKLLVSAVMSGTKTHQVLIYDIRREKTASISEGDFPIWTPDGTRVLYLHEGALFIHEGSGKRKITGTLKGRAQLLFCVDNYAVFTSEQDTKSEILRIDFESGSKPLTIAAFVPRYKKASLENISVTQDGTMIFGYHHFSDAETLDVSERYMLDVKNCKLALMDDYIGKIKGSLASILDGKARLPLSELAAKKFLRKMFISEKGIHLCLFLDGPEYRGIEILSKRAFEGDHSWTSQRPTQVYLSGDSTAVCFSPNDQYCLAWETYRWYLLSAFTGKILWEKFESNGPAIWHPDSTKFVLARTNFTPEQHLFLYSVSHPVGHYLAGFPGRMKSVHWQPK